MWHMGDGQKKARTAFHFKVDRKRVQERVQNEELIRATKLTTRKSKSGRKVRYPIADRKCMKIFRRLRGEGKSVKRYWFNQGMRQLIQEHYPD